MSERAFRMKAGPRQTLSQSLRGATLLRRRVRAQQQGGTAKLAGGLVRGVGVEEKEKEVVYSRCERSPRRTLTSLSSPSRTTVSVI